MTGEDMGDGTPPSSRRLARIWAAAFILIMIAFAFVANWLALPMLGRLLFMMLPMLLLIPMIRSIERAQAACGNFSLALQRYNRRSLIWSFTYVVALFVAIWVNRSWHPDGVVAWAIAILPALPLLFFIYAMGRYLVEEKDEYLRQRAILSALWATGILLSVATCYGFLEMFNLVPHQPGWWAVPVWAVGLGIGNFIVRRSA